MSLMTLGMILQFTGRVVENRRWSDGIHQAVEAKEGLRIQVPIITFAFRGASLCTRMQSDV